METIIDGIDIRLDLPYPPVAVTGRNPQYARMILSNIGSCNSEMSAVSLYFYNSLIGGEYAAEIGKIFHAISIVEMHHLDIFGRLSMLLGCDPRLWSQQNNGRNAYWSPACNRYPRPLKTMLQNSITAEEEAIKKYERQAKTIKDPDIVANLERIILDEKHHVEIFHILQDRYLQPTP